jgi:signal transduction histidine kinase
MPEYRVSVAGFSQFALLCSMLQCLSFVDAATYPEQPCIPLVAARMPPKKDSHAERVRRAELAKLEEMLRENERLAQIGRLSASIAHEIKNPLEALTNVLYLLESCASSDKQLEYIALGKEEITRAVTVANQTLDFARGASNPVPVKIRGVLDEVLDFYARKISYKQLSVEVRHNFDGEVESSPGELRQIFSNLVVNALEVLEEGRGAAKTPQLSMSQLGILGPNRRESCRR